MKSLYARWVPHTLSEAQQQQRVEGAQRVLNEMNENVIIIDEKWLFANPLPPRQQVRAWVDEAGDRPKLPRGKIADKKFHIIVAISFRGDFSFQVLPRNESINADRYVNFLEERVLPLRRNLIVMHDKARPHTANITRNFFNENGMTLLRQAPYSPDFNLLDRFVFRNMEFERRDRYFENKETVEEFLQVFLRQKMTRGKLQRELHRLRSDMQDIIAIGGDYLYIFRIIM